MQRLIVLWESVRAVAGAVYCRIMYGPDEENWPKWESDNDSDAQWDEYFVDNPRGYDEHP